MELLLKFHLDVLCHARDVLRCVATKLFVKPDTLFGIFGRMYSLFSDSFNS